MIKRSLISLVLAAIVIGLLAGCGGLPKSAVAEVNGKVITREDLDKEIENVKIQFGGQGFPEQGTPEFTDLEKRLVEQLVTVQIIGFEAEEMDIIITDDEIEDQLDQIKQQAGGEEQFQTALESQNFTEDRLKEQIRLQLLTTRVFEKITEDVEVTDEELLTYYNTNQTSPQLQRPETKSVRHVLVADEAAALQVKARLDSGEDFAKVATEVSTDPGSKDKGGDLGAQPAGSFVPEFEQAMATLAVNQISAPVKSSFGWHIIQVTAVNPAGLPPFEEAKEDIRQFLLQERQQEVAEQWLTEAKTRYTITYAPEFDPAAPAETPTAPEGTTTDLTSTQPAATPPAAQPAAPAPVQP